MPAEPRKLLVFVGSFAPGDDGAIQAFDLDSATAAMVPRQRTGDIEHPFFLARTPDGRFLYAVHEPGQFGGDGHGQVAAYRIVDRGGELKALNRQTARGSATCYLEVDPSGRVLLLANYNSGSVASLPIREDGSLGEIVTIVQHDGSSMDSKRQKGPHAHCIAASPDGRHAHAADLGTDQVLHYRLNADAATLAPNTQPFLKAQPGAGPRHLTFHPNGHYAYVINELHNSITMFDHDADAGTLTERQTISTLPDSFDGVSYCADLKVTANGRTLYGTNRGHDSIACYAVGADGRLSLLRIEPSLGAGPQNLAITPDDQMLLCANLPGNSVAIFRIDAGTGTLARACDPVAIASPSCIVIL